MKKQRKKIILLVAVFQILAITLLAACDGNTPVSACHATGDLEVPYEEISIDVTSAKEHIDHPDDIFPVPVGGCPTSPLVIEDGKITICHATTSESNPYNEISVRVNGLNGHETHDDDIIPSPAGGCPTSSLEIEDGKINICHATDSETNPYNEISVSVNGLNGHVSHGDDIIPAPDDGCPTNALVIDNGKIMICHATGSEKNPYNKISVSVNGFNGHDKHSGDIIPAPAGDCPGIKQ